jgi:hypothetical protein
MIVAGQITNPCSNALLRQSASSHHQSINFPLNGFQFSLNRRVSGHQCNLMLENAPQYSGFQMRVASPLLAFSS